MALNVLSMKYPASQSGKWHKNEVEAIEPDAISLSKKARKIASLQTEDVAGCNNMVAEIKRLDGRIAALMREREFAWSELETESKRATEKIFDFTCDAAAKIESAFGKSGFASKTVCKAVKAVRDVLFDDSLEVFRQIVCAGVNYDRNDRELTFTFEHAPTGNCFRIDVPVFLPGARQYEDYYRARQGLCVGPVYGICVVYAFDSCRHNSISYHYDVRIVREQLRLFAERGFVPVTRDEDSERYERRFFLGNDEYRMSIDDYAAEAEY